MEAILLVAGVGARLRPLTDERPKSLLEVGGQTLLARHLDLLAARPGVRGVTLVVGYLQPLLRAEAEAWAAARGSRLRLAFLENPDYERGSLLSLRVARDLLRAGDTLVMDADVLYHPEVLGRLVDAPEATCLLVDPGCDDSGEEMLVCVREGLARHVARGRDPSTRDGWDLTGETVGFCRFSREDGARLVEHMDALVAEGRLDAEYEVALARLLAERPCAWRRVDDLPWTEIDFPHDLARARDEVLPAIEAATRG